LGFARLGKEQGRRRQAEAKQGAIAARGPILDHAVAKIPSYRAAYAAMVLYFSMGRIVSDSVRQMGLGDLV
jgi:hypothetical protein